jgi:hypothetical protein
LVVAGCTLGHTLCVRTAGSLSVAGGGHHASKSTRAIPRAAAEVVLAISCGAGGPSFSGGDPQTQPRPPSARMHGEASVLPGHVARSRQLRDRTVGDKASPNQMSFRPLASATADNVLVFPPTHVPPAPKPHEARVSEHTTRWIPMVAAPSTNLDPPSNGVPQPSAHSSDDDDASTSSSSSLSASALVAPCRSHTGPGAVTHSIGSVGNQWGHRGTTDCQ